MSRDIVERLRDWNYQEVDDAPRADMLEAADEIERLQELLRGTGANRYWEGRWRDEKAENERLRAALEEITALHDVNADECMVMARRALDP